MNIKVSPFLVSSNQYLDYRTVAAPNFLCEAKISGLLKAATADEEDVTEPGYAIYREIHNSKVGDITLVFRVVKATKKDINLESNEIIRDKFGRAIYLIEGIVLRERISDIVVTAETLEEAHKRIVPVYSDFWKRTSDVTVVALENFNLEKYISSNNRLNLKFRKPYIVSKPLTEIKAQPPVEPNDPIITSSNENLKKLIESFVRTSTGGIFVLVIFMLLIASAFFFRQAQP